MSDDGKRADHDVQGRMMGRASGPVSAKVRILSSAEIFADANEIVIEHNQEHYRLRNTRKGKLILTK